MVLVLVLMHMYIYKSNLSKDEWTAFPHLQGIPLHYFKISANSLGKIRLIYYLQLNLKKVKYNLYLGWIAKIKIQLSLQKI